MAEYGFGGQGFEEFLRGGEENLKKINEMKERMAEAVGKGEGADGRVRAEYTSGGGLTALELDPRAMRLPAEDLAKEIMTAVNAASKDFQSKLTELVGSVTGSKEDVDTMVKDPSAVKAQAEKLGDTFAGQMKDVLREVTAQQERARQLMDRLPKPPDQRS